MFILCINDQFNSFFEDYIDSLLLTLALGLSKHFHFHSFSTRKCLKKKKILIIIMKISET